MHLLNPADFLAQRLPVPMHADEIHLWFFPGQRGPATETPANHDVLRGVLASYLKRAASDVHLEHGVHGKPFLADSGALQFNQSHSGGALLIAVSREQAIGVDLEIARRPRPALDLARRYFTPSEAAALAALPEPIQHAAFLELWSCKEAVLKAIGQGIGFGLSRLSFALDAAGHPLQMTAIHASAGSPEQWQVLRLAPATGHIGALAWRGPARALRAFIHV
jgi:4'-phosphopantetheinyl transferase